MGELITLPVPPRDRLREIYRYGTAAGLEAILAVDPDCGAPLPLHLAPIGPDPLGIKIVASFSHDAEGRQTANRVAATVLRSLHFAEWTCAGSSA